MANENLFTSLVGKLIPPTDAINEEQAPAYAFSAKHKLAQYAATGCLNSTFYASGKDQFDQVMALCAVVEPEFIAKTAVYCREKGFMKDMPALLCAALSTRDFGAVGGDLPPCDRQREDAQKLRADHAFRRCGTKIAGICSEAAGAELV